MATLTILDNASDSNGGDNKPIENLSIVLSKERSNIQNCIKQQQNFEGGGGGGEEKKKTFNNMLRINSSSSNDNNGSNCLITQFQKEKILLVPFIKFLRENKNLRKNKEIQELLHAKLSKETLLKILVKPEIMLIWKKESVKKKRERNSFSPKKKKEEEGERQNKILL